MDKKQQLEQGNTEAVKRRRRKYIILTSVIAFIMAFVLIIGYAFSWFRPPSFNIANTESRVTNFTASVLRLADSDEEYHLLNNDTNVNRDDRFYVISGTTTATSAHKKNINLSSLKVRYTGESSAYLKVQLHESWYAGTNASNAVPIADQTVSYTLDSDLWVYNPDDDSYYTKEPVHVEDGQTSKDISFVTEMESTPSVSSTYVYFYLVAVIESVQPDRYPEFGFDIPQTTQETTA